jgi:hypothetical protein
MRAWLIRVLWALLRWLGGDLPPVPAPPPDPLFDAACVLVLELQGLRHTGHFKRCLAIKALRRQFPGTRGRDVAWAVERAVREVA